MNVSSQIVDGTRWQMPVLGCRICDKDRDPLEIPDEPCGHAYENRTTFTVEMVPAAEAIRLRDLICELKDDLESIEFFRGEDDLETQVWVQRGLAAIAACDGRLVRDIPDTPEQHHQAS